MSLLSDYLRAVRRTHQTGAATQETSYYSALEAVFDAVGETLSPEVECVMELKNAGAGNPDGGLFTASQIGASGGPLIEQDSIPLPERGAIEVKPAGVDLDALQDSEQVERYAAQYGLVLITNLRAFRLLEKEGDALSVKEEFELATTEEEFWMLAARAESVPDVVAERFEEFVARAMTRNAPLADPQDVASLLASYATDARLRLEGRELSDLDLLRTSLEEALGVEYRGRRGTGFFVSTVVQTLFYGMFSAWVLWHREDPTREDAFDWHRAAEYLRVPLLERLFLQVVAPSQLRRLRLLEIMNWTADTLNRVDRPSFFAQFQEEEAVQYFYEPFLERFDPSLREDLGVWYTPTEIVEYMVHRVDTVLREELDIADGLASDDVLVLDPCCGTGAYIVAVLRLIRDRLVEQGRGALTGQLLRKAACERIFGFEILTAPYVVAHLQIGLFLAEMESPLLESEDDRAAVYLTNALTGWDPDEASGEKRTFPEFKNERLAAERVKQDRKILVVLGNPPYSGYAGMAMGEERDLSNAYRTTRHAPDPQGHGLNDLYVRFFRMAERQIVEQTEQGVVCFISNYSWLDGLSHTGMRERYVDCFDRIWIDNLNGDRYRTGKTTPDGGADPSIFSTPYNRAGIQVGTAVATLCRHAPHDDAHTVHDDAHAVHYREFWGTSKRSDVHETKDLSGTDHYETLSPPVELGYPFMPRTTGENYLDWPKLPELFPTSFPGVKTSRDDALVDTDRDRLEERMRAYFDPDVPDARIEEMAPRLMKSTRRFDPQATRRRLIARGFKPGNIVPYCYRPMDVRWLYWEPETKLLDRERSDYFPHVFDGNRWISSEQRNRKQHFYLPQVSIVLADHHIVESNSGLFPLFLNPKTGGNDLFSQPDGSGEPIPNLSDDAEAYLEGLGDEAAGVEMLFYHTIAVLHAPRYREENEGALRQDWPRVPLPQDAGGLRASADLGREVADLLDVEAPVGGVTSGSIDEALRPLGVPEPCDGERSQLRPSDFAVTAGWGYEAHHGATMPGGGTYDERSRTPDEAQALPEGAIERWGDTVYDVYLNETARWRNVPSRVWAYTLGGYPVIKKWLSYREDDVLDRRLTLDEVQHVTEMTRRIAALLLLEPRLDENYERVVQ